jgi:hypothetical protein
LIGMGLIEALLASRLWLQLSGANLNGVSLVLFDLSQPFVYPFRGVELSDPIKRTGIVELATLVALECYLVLLLITSLLFLLIPKRGRADKTFDSKM